ncbi:rhodanese-like domain-containing protein [Thermodesulfobacteriota bacterium]
MKRRIWTVLIIWSFILFIPYPGYSDTSNIPKIKQTDLGLYIKAKEAFAKWQTNSGSVHILDVRTPEEYIFVGHAPMARNIPVRLMNQRLTAERKKLVLEANPNFVSAVKKYYQPFDKLLIMCRSGGRSAQAVNLLKKAGFKYAYNIIDGFEGDTIKDTHSYYHGKRVKNGWKNAGVPWTFKLDPQLVYSP